MKKNLISIIFTILFSITFISAQEQYNCPMGGGMMYGISGNYGIGYAVLSWILYVVVIGLAGAGIYWLIKNANKKSKK